MKCPLTSATGKRFLALEFAFGLTAAATTSAQAQTLSVIYNFTNGTDGGTPLAGLTADGKGDLYGTANSGGGGYGTVFKLKNSSGSWTMDPIHSFASGADGAAPDARLMRSPDGTFYGTTVSGGPGDTGTVFHVGPGGESVIYTFLAGSDGYAPSSGDLAFDKGGNVYGTTGYGGANGNGTVFELVRPKGGGAWTHNVLYSFGTGTDGAVPIGGVVFDKLGNLYGTTSIGGAYGFGTIYELQRSGTTWMETILYNFQDSADGGTPYAGLIMDKSGNLYGGTVSGGGGGGAIFELSPTNGSWTYTVLYGIPGGAVSGPFRNLVLDPSGNLYGTTHCDGTYSEGTVYKLTPSNGTWTYTLLYEFSGTGEGYYVFSNLVLDKLGNLYGTASVGGANGYGVIFEITP